MGALGFTGYVWFRVVSSFFYAPLGVTPEEAGVRYPTVIAQAAYGVVFILVVSAFIVAAGLLLVWYPARLMPDWPALERHQERTAAAVVCIAVVLVTIGTQISWVTAVVLACFVFIWVIGRYFFADVKTWVVVAVCAAATLFLVLAYPLVSASELADNAREGRTSAAFPWAVPLLPWGAQVAMVTWKEKPPPGFEDDTCVLYLGESSQGALLYTEGEEGMRRLLRVPAAEAIVQTYPDGYACEDWRPPA